MAQQVWYYLCAIGINSDRYEILSFGLIFFKIEDWNILSIFLEDDKKRCVEPDWISIVKWLMG